MTKPLYVGTSWKMHKTAAEAREFAETLRDAKLPSGIESFVIPGFTNIRLVKEILSQTNVLVGAQNMHWADQGAWTGEVSPLQLVDCHMDLVEIGHSERREFFGETNETVGLKVEAAVRHGLIPLICLGETAEDKDAGRASEVLAEETREALKRVAKSEAEIWLAYEPVWAIGENGVPASAQYANERQREIKDIARAIMGHDIPCLYGGSVNLGNAAELIAQPAIDGLFIGRSAWNCDDYLRILELCSETTLKQGL